MPAVVTSPSAELRARIAVSMIVAALLPVFAMDMVVLNFDFSRLRPGAIDMAVIGTGLAAGVAGLLLGWILSGVVVRYANQRVADATRKHVELTRELQVQRDRLEDAMDGSRLAMWELDMGTGEIHLSANWWSLMGGTPRETTGSIAELIDRVPDGEQMDCWAAVRAVLRGTSNYYDVEHRVRRDDGSMMWIRSRGAVSARSADGRVLRMTGTNFDVTARKNAELALQESEAKLRLVTDNLPLMVTYLDADLRILFANRHHLAHFGAPIEKVLNRPLAEVAGVETELLVRAHIDDLRKGETVTLDRERADVGGDTRHYEMRLVPQAGSGGLAGIFMVIHDITERALAARLLEQLALSDPLTSLPNKRLLVDRVERSIAQTGRRDGCTALLFVDLDGFKRVNDTMGHSEGDRLLQSVAARLRGCVRAADTVARLGGDEFVVLLEACESDEDAQRVAGKITEALAQPFQLGTGCAEISCSVGVALHPRDGETAETLLQRADAAMYRAKQSGKNRVASYSGA